MKMRAKITMSLGALALGLALAPVPAFAQEVWQTYPMTVSSPAFGPGVARPAAPAVRPLYNVVPQAPAAAGREVWQTYPMTISSPAFGPGGK